MSRSRERYSQQAEMLASAVRRARKGLGMSQQLLAERSGISIGTVRNIEQCVVTDPGLFEVVAIAAAMGVGVEELIAEELYLGASGVRDGVATAQSQSS